MTWWAYLPMPDPEPEPDLSALLGEVRCGQFGCDQFPHTTDVTDPGLSWCTRCGACLGRPFGRGEGTLDLSEPLFGHPPTTP